jgi:hypothetical protein
VCGAKEWQHLCSGRAPSEIERRVQAKANVTKLAVTKIKRGRPPVSGKAMTAAERKRRQRSK